MHNALAQIINLIPYGHNENDQKECLKQISEDINEQFAKNGINNAALILDFNELFLLINNSSLFTHGLPDTFKNFIEKMQNSDLQSIVSILNQHNSKSLNNASAITIDNHQSFNNASAVPEYNQQSLNTLNWLKESCNIAHKLRKNDNDLLIDSKYKIPTGIKQLLSFIKTQEILLLPGQAHAIKQFFQGKMTYTCLLQIQKNQKLIQYIKTIVDDKLIMDKNYCIDIISNKNYFISKVSNNKNSLSNKKIIEYDDINQKVKVSTQGTHVAVTNIDDLQFLKLDTISQLLQNKSNTNFTNTIFAKMIQYRYLSIQLLDELDVQTKTTKTNKLILLLDEIKHDLNILTPNLLKRKNILQFINNKFLNQLFNLDQESFHGIVNILHKETVFIEINKWLISTLDENIKLGPAQRRVVADIRPQLLQQLRLNMLPDSLDNSKDINHRLQKVLNLIQVNQIILSQADRVFIKQFFKCKMSLECLKVLISSSAYKYVEISIHQSLLIKDELLNQSFLQNNQHHNIHTQLNTKIYLNKDNEIIKSYQIHDNEYIKIPILKQQLLINNGHVFTFIQTTGGLGQFKAARDYNGKILYYKKSQICYASIQNQYNTYIQERKNIKDAKLNHALSVPHKKRKTDKDDKPAQTTYLIQNYEAVEPKERAPKELMKAKSNLCKELFTQHDKYSDDTKPSNYILCIDAEELKFIRIDMEHLYDYNISSSPITAYFSGLSFIKQSNESQREPLLEQYFLYIHKPDIYKHLVSIRNFYSYFMTILNLDKNDTENLIDQSNPLLIASMLKNTHNLDDASIKIITNFLVDTVEMHKEITGYNEISQNNINLNDKNNIFENNTTNDTLQQVEQRLANLMDNSSVKYGSNKDSILITQLLSILKPIEDLKIKIKNEAIIFFPQNDNNSELNT